MALPLGQLVAAAGIELFSDGLGTPYAAGLAGSALTNIGILLMKQTKGDFSVGAKVEHRTATEHYKDSSQKKGQDVKQTQQYNKIMSQLTNYNPSTETPEEHLKKVQEYIMKTLDPKKFPHVIPPTNK